MTGIWQSVLGGTFAPVSAIIVCIAAAAGVVWYAGRRTGTEPTAMPLDEDEN